MRVGLQTWGSEGDVRPFLALGAALAARGHRVRLLITEIDERDYAAYARPLGIDIQMVASPVLNPTTVDSGIPSRMIAKTSGTTNEDL